MNNIGVELWEPRVVIAFFLIVCIGIFSTSAVGKLPAVTVNPNSTSEVITPEQFGAKGDGVADDTSAVKKALKQAGMNGTVQGNGVYKLKSLLGYVEAKRAGAGKFKFEDAEWPFATTSSGEKQQADFPDKTIVADTRYSHFPNFARYKNLVVGAYNSTLSHGQANIEAIVQRQKMTKAGSFFLNGNMANGEKVKLNAATKLNITVTTDESHRDFIIKGTKNGVPSEIKVRGPKKGTLTTTLADKLDAISSVETDGSTSGPVSIGLDFVPGNVEVKFSTNSGRNFSRPIVVGDGMSEGKYLYYSSSLGVSNDGMFVVVYNRLGIDNAERSSLRRASRDGRLWSEPEKIRYGKSQSAKTLAMYGEIKTTPSGRFVMLPYSGTENWAFVSAAGDYGRNWTPHLIVDSKNSKPDVNYSEMGLAIISESTWLAVARVDGRVDSFRQFLTLDAGKTWKNVGSVNIPPSGGYVSPQIAVIDANNQKEMYLFFMVRKSVSAPSPYGNKLVVIKRNVSEPLNSNTKNVKWNNKITVIDSNLEMRSGYPSIIFNEQAQDFFVFYGKEYSLFKADVQGKKQRISDIAN